MFQDTGRIRRPYKYLIVSSEGWDGAVFRANDIVFDDEKHFNSLISENL